MKKILISPNFVLLTLSISIAYYIAIMFLTNKDLLIGFGLSSSSFITKLQLFFLIFFPWRNFLNPDLLLLSSVSILTGINLGLLFTELRYLAAHRIGIFSGGSSILGAAGSGCIVVCSSLPFFIATSLTGSSILLPLFANLKYISPLLLVISLYLMIKNYKKVCKIEKQKTY